MIQSSNTHSNADASLGEKNEESEIGIHNMKKAKLKWPMFAGMALLIAVGTTGYAEFNGGLITKTLTGIFGPPRIALQETFLENSDGPMFDHSSFNAIL